MSQKKKDLLKLDIQRMGDDVDVDEYLLAMGIDPDSIPPADETQVERVMEKCFPGHAARNKLQQN